MTLQTNLANLATRMATECKALRTLVNGNAVNLADLSTTQKASLLLAINELHAALQVVRSEAGVIDDAATTSGNTWSGAKVAAEIQAAKNALTNGSAAALDTLAELAAALGDDANFASNMTAALGKRVRVDAAQTFTTSEKLQACENLGIGDTEANFVTTFNTALA